MAWKNALPVIVRELRGQARHGFTYWTRVIAATVALGVAIVSAVATERDQWTGAELFSLVQPTLFSLIWTIGPIMTCDCISRERREGTLGLLLLTSLRPIDVAIAKAFTGIVRSFMAVVAVAPMLAIALLLGGISVSDLGRAALMDVMALLAAGAAGLLASSLCRRFGRAALLSLLFSGFALQMLGSLQTGYFVVDNAVQLDWNRAEEMLGILVFGPWFLCAGSTEIWGEQGGVLPPEGYLWLSGGQVVLAGTFLFLVLRYLNRRLPTLSVESGLTPRQQRWWQEFCTPRLFTSFLRRHQAWLLDRNPVGWLHQRTWSARLATWGWLGVIAVVETILISMGSGYGSVQGILEGQVILFGFMAAGMAFSASTSLAHERETRSLELLLVTPLRVHQIILGRLFGLWGQYVLAFGLLSGAFIYVAKWGGEAWYWDSWGGQVFVEHWFLTVLVFLSTYLFLPVIGLDQSMRRKHFLSSYLMTLALAVVLPSLMGVLWLFGLGLAWGLGFEVRAPEIHRCFAFSGIGLQLLLASRAGWRLHWILTQRRFSVTS